MESWQLFSVFWGESLGPSLVGLGHALHRKLHGALLGQNIVLSAGFRKLLHFQIKVANAWLQMTCILVHTAVHVQKTCSSRNHCIANISHTFHVHDGVKNKSWVSLEGRGGLVNTGQHYCTSMEFQGHNLIGWCGNYLPCTGLPYSSHFTDLLSTPQITEAQQTTSKT